MKKITLLILCGLLATTSLSAQTWNIGTPTATAVIASETEFGVANGEGNVSETAEIYNLSGVLTASYPITSKTTTVNVSQLPSGTYVLKIGRYAGKFVKK